VATANGNVDVTGAWLVLEEFELRPVGACDVDGQQLIVAPVLVDLFSATMPPELTGITPDPAGYCRIEFKWDGFETAPAGAPANLTNHSILVQGTTGDGTPFVIRTRRDDDLRIQTAGAGLVVDDALARLFIGFDMSVALAGIDFASAVETGGVIFVDHDSNTTLREVFDNNIVSATKLFRDSDDDGSLDSDEDDDEDELGGGF
jgi:hypothetical protein